MARALLRVRAMTTCTRPLFLLLACCACGPPGDGEFCELTPAIADAGADQEVFTGSTVQLDGSGSQAETLIVFDWSFASAPAGSTARISGSSARPTFIADRAGRYEVNLVIHAGGCISHPDTVTIAAGVR